MKRRRILIASLVLIIALAAAIFFMENKASAPARKANAPSDSANKIVEAQAAPTFNKSRYSLADPASSWVIVNKQRKLQPSDYAPSDLTVPDITMKSGITSDENRLRGETATALEQLAKAAKAENITLTMQSGYRSYAYQTALYGRYVREQGQSAADTQSARPGYSEHQTGLAVDLGGTSRPACNIEQCYEDTPEGRWIAANAYKYGFVVRYPEGKQSVTGYIYEPWHLRYVGTSLAAEMHGTSAATLEEFFGLPAAPDYN